MISRQIPPYAVPRAAVRAEIMNGGSVPAAGNGALRPGQVALIQRPRSSGPATTGDTVTVACKVPAGLILRIFREETYEDQQPGGGTKTTRHWVPIPDQQFVVRGTWAASAGQAYSLNNPAVAELLPGGYALTHGCPKWLWDKWYEQNRGTAIVRERIVFAARGLPTVTKSAQELGAVKSGLEPVSQEHPAERMPGGVDRRLRLDVLVQDSATTPR